MSNDGKKQCLLAMIDGDTSRFAVSPMAKVPRLGNQWSTKTSDYPTFIDALQQYLKLHGLDPREHETAIAVAGVVRGDVVSVAHCRWYITLSGLQSFLRSKPLVLNEMAATAWSLTALDTSRARAIGSGQPKAIAPGHTFLVLAAGVGLGVAALHVTGDGSIVVLQSEGGHMSFAAQDGEDDALLAALRRRFGHVSYERLISAEGLRTIYESLPAAAGKAAPAGAAGVQWMLRQKSDAAVSSALRVFAEALGSFASNMTLALGAWDGTFLAGELLGQLLPSLPHQEIRRAFAAKGRLAKTLQDVPLALLDQKDASLIGAAAALHARNGGS